MKDKGRMAQMKSLKISQARNGYLVAVDGELDYIIPVEEGTSFPRRAECKALEALCVEIVDFFGLGWNEHESHNLVITVNKSTHGLEKPK